MTRAFALLGLAQVTIGAAAIFARFALTGVALVAGFPSRTETPLGIALALTGAIALAGYLTLVGSGDARYGTLAVVARTYPIAALVLGIAALAARDGVPPLAATGAWAGILAMGVRLAVVRGYGPQRRRAHA